MSAEGIPLRIWYQVSTVKYRDGYAITDVSGGNCNGISGVIKQFYEYPKMGKGSSRMLRSHHLHREQQHPAPRSAKVGHGEGPRSVRASIAECNSSGESTWSDLVTKISEDNGRPTGQCEKRLWEESCREFNQRRYTLDTRGAETQCSPHHQGRRKNRIGAECVSRCRAAVVPRMIHTRSGRYHGKKLQELET